MRTQASLSLKSLVLISMAASIFIGGTAIHPAISEAAQKGASNRAPKLYEPHETVTLRSDGAGVPFRWGASGLRGDAHLHDEFRVFKGNQAYADSMIFDEQVPAGKGSIEVPATVFAEPGVYCWTVRQIGSRDKSRKAFSVFKVHGS
ncbi:MAG: hypothetical protein KBD07_03890 [Candidatus Omnitrophica bacterium]|jgi:hypothetical protein|nr:hypothetical protein [Candidatus Omnitrophota bacterium]